MPSPSPTVTSGTFGVISLIDTVNRVLGGPGLSPMLVKPVAEVPVARVLPTSDDVADEAIDQAALERDIDSFMNEFGNSSSSEMDDDDGDDDDSDNPMDLVPDHERSRSVAISNLPSNKAIRHLNRILVEISCPLPEKVWLHCDKMEPGRASPSSVATVLIVDYGRTIQVLDVVGDGTLPRCAVVRFGNPDDALKALACDGRAHDGRVIGARLLDPDDVMTVPILYRVGVTGLLSALISNRFRNRAIACPRQARK